MAALLYSPVLLLAPQTSRCTHLYVLTASNPFSRRASLRNLRAISASKTWRSFNARITDDVAKLSCGAFCGLDSPRVHPQRRSPLCCSQFVLGTPRVASASTQPANVLRHPPPPRRVSPSPPDACDVGAGRQGVVPAEVRPARAAHGRPGTCCCALPPTRADGWRAEGEESREAARVRAASDLRHSCPTLLPFPPTLLHSAHLCLASFSVPRAPWPPWWCMQGNPVSKDLAVTASLTYSHDCRYSGAPALSPLHPLLPPSFSPVRPLPSHTLPLISPLFHPLEGYNHSCTCSSFFLHASLLPPPAIITPPPTPPSLTIPFATAFSPTTPLAPPLRMSSAVKLEEGQAMVEPPLFTTFNGVEFPAHLRPSQMLAGRATFKLALSVLSSKCDNRLFAVCFTAATPLNAPTPLNADGSPLLVAPGYSRAIRRPLLFPPASALSPAPRRWRGKASHEFITSPPADVAHDLPSWRMCPSPSAPLLCPSPSSLLPSPQGPHKPRSLPPTPSLPIPSPTGGVAHSPSPRAAAAAAAMPSPSPRAFSTSAPSPTGTVGSTSAMSAHGSPAITARPSPSLPPRSSPSITPRPSPPAPSPAAPSPAPSPAPATPAPAPSPSLDSSMAGSSGCHVSSEQMMSQEATWSTGATDARPAPALTPPAPLAPSPLYAHAPPRPPAPPLPVSASDPPAHPPGSFSHYLTTPLVFPSSLLSTPHHALPPKTLSYSQSYSACYSRAPADAYAAPSVPGPGCGVDERGEEAAATYGEASAMVPTGQFTGQFTGQSTDQSALLYRHVPLQQIPEQAAEFLVQSEQCTWQQPLQHAVKMETDGEEEEGMHEGQDHGLGGGHVDAESKEGVKGCGDGYAADLQVPSLPLAHINTSLHPHHHRHQQPFHPTHHHQQQQHQHQQLSAFLSEESFQGSLSPFNSPL
ncbi:unnamed protein product, partial [Closterium sp. NIES-53]